MGNDDQQLPDYSYDPERYHQETSIWCNSENTGCVVVASLGALFIGVVILALLTLLL
jgi:hypothetical protein